MVASRNGANRKQRVNFSSSRKMIMAVSRSIRWDLRVSLRVCSYRFTNGEDDADIPLWRIDQDDLRIVACRDLDRGFITDRRAIARSQFDAIYDRFAFGHGQISVPASLKRIGHALSGLQHRRQDAGVLADGQRALCLISFEARRERDQ